MSTAVPANTPYNTAAAADIDHKVVAATMYSNIKAAVDYAADFSQEFQAPINGQRTSTVMIRIAPSIALSDTPSTRTGTLDRTGVTAETSVEIALTGDKYFKVAVDTYGVEPGQIETELGAAGAKAIVKAGNADLLGAIVGQGTGTAFGASFGAATTGDAVWAALQDELVAFQDGEYDTSNLVLYVKPVVWARLAEGVATLRTSVNPQETAAALLGVAKVRPVAFPQFDADPTAGTDLRDVLFSLADAGSIAQAKIFAGIRTTQEDWDNLVQGRVKYGTKVLDANVVRFVYDGA